MSERPTVKVVGAGLAGCEAAHQLSRHGIAVRLYEMKPKELSPAHHSPLPAELVCSNSLRSDRPENAVGLLKEELRRMGSLLLECADACAVPAGGALAVDREAFSRAVDERIRANPLIDLCSERIDRLPTEGLTIVATGPLTHEKLFADIERFTGSAHLHFFDAAAPLIFADSINREIAFRQSRYDKGSADYLNCPMNQEEYELFYEALRGAQTADIKDFDKVFEGCMPIEVLASRGADAIRYGMLKPVGLRDPRSGRRPYAVVQLRQDNAAASLYNLVGFQTRLKFSEQKRVFRMIPGLEAAEFARYGVMHRNQFINSPQVLSPSMASRKDAGLFFAGQMTGVEGYVESCASGLVAGQNAARLALGRSPNFILPPTCVCGALQRYVAEADADHFQPMNANFGLLPEVEEPVKKAEKKARLLARARRDLAAFLSEQPLELPL